MDSPRRCERVGVNNALVEYWTVLRGRWRWLAWGVLLAVSATTLWLIAQPPLYRSDATVFIRTPGDVSRVIDGGDSYARARAQTYAVLANSPGVAARVAADMGLALDPQILAGRIQAAVPHNTALIEISVRAASGAEAQRAATVLITELSATMGALESVPGSVVPRAELITVDPPGAPARVVAFGAPVPLVLLVAALAGLVLSALAAVLRSVFEPPLPDSADIPQLLASADQGTADECEPADDR